MILLLLLLVASPIMADIDRWEAFAYSGTFTYLQARPISYTQKLVSDGQRFDVMSVSQFIGVGYCFKGGEVE